jgi:outer membrane protein assembly factor BamB
MMISHTPPAIVVPFRATIPGKLRLVTAPRVTRSGIWVDAMPMGKGNSALYRLSLSGRVQQRISLPGLSMWTPVVYDGRVIVGLGGSYMYFHHGLGNCNSGRPHGWVAYSIRTGKVVWERLGLCQTMPTAALRNGVLYGVGANGRFDAVDAKTGKRLWRIRKRWSPAMSDPVLSGRFAVFGFSRIPVGDVFNPAESVAAVNLRTHAVQWEFTPKNAINLGESTVVVHKGVVYATWYTRRYDSVIPALAGAWAVEKSFHMAALRLDTGQVLWNLVYAKNRQNLWNRLMGKIAKRPPITDGPLEFANGDILSSPKNTGHLYALSAATGKVRWKAPTYPYNVSLPTYCSGKLWFLKAADRHSVLEELSPETGEVLQKEVLPAIGRTGPGAPVCLSNSLLLWGTTSKGIVIQNMPQSSAVPRETAGIATQTR